MTGTPPRPGAGPGDGPETDAEALARRLARREQQQAPPAPRRIDGDDGSEAEMFEDVPV